MSKLDIQSLPAIDAKEDALSTTGAVPDCLNPLLISNVQVGHLLVAGQKYRGYRIGHHGRCVRLSLICASFPMSKLDIHLLPARSTEATASATTGAASGCLKSAPRSQCSSWTFTSYLLEGDKSGE